MSMSPLISHVPPRMVLGASFQHVTVVGFFLWQHPFHCENLCIGKFFRYLTVIGTFSLVDYVLNILTEIIKTIIISTIYHILVNNSLWNNKVKKYKSTVKLKSKSLVFYERRAQFIGSIVLQLLCSGTFCFAVLKIQQLKWRHHWFKRYKRGCSRGNFNKTYQCGTGFLFLVSMNKATPFRATPGHVIRLKMSHFFYRARLASPKV